MEIILLERIDKLGQMGDVVTVKDGYARNFLLPRGKALRATDANKAKYEAERKEIEARNLERRAEAESVSGKLDGTKIVLLRQAGEGGQLYGSATPRDIAAGLTEKGFNVDRTQVVLDHPIKEIGLHQVTVRLHPEVSVGVSVNVARSSEEAELQLEAAQKEALIAQDVFESEELAEAAAEALSEAPEEEPEAEAAETEESGEAETEDSDAAETEEQTGEEAEDDKSEA